MKFRNATLDDLESISKIESLCFPANEAASKESFSNRLQIFPQHFFVLEMEGQLIGYVNGMVTDHQTITDEMFVKAELHNEAGGWQTIFGIAVIPEYRKHGYAGKLLNQLITQAREQKRTGVTLTCKEYLIDYYQRFSFIDLGLSNSTHGGVAWHDMILKF